MVNYVRQAAIHTAEPVVPEPSVFDVEKAIEKIKRLTSPYSDKMPAEILKTGA